MMRWKVPFKFERKYLKCNFIIISTLVDAKNTSNCKFKFESYGLSDAYLSAYSNQINGAWFKVFFYKLLPTCVKTHQ
jgi:hypothetical protein